MLRSICMIYDPERDRTRLSIIHLSRSRRSPSRQASTSLKTIRTEHAISVRKLLNNITVNLPRLVGVMIAPSDNLLLIIPGRGGSLAYICVCQAPTTKLTTNWNIARARNQRKNYLTAAIMLELAQVLKLPFPHCVCSYPNPFSIAADSTDFFRGCPIHGN